MEHYLKDNSIFQLKDNFDKKAFKWAQNKIQYNQKETNIQPTNNSK